MYLHRLILSFASVCCLSADDSCPRSRAYAKLFKDLDFSNNTNLTKNTPPIPDYNDYVWVSIDLYVNAITDVNEKAQSITTQVKVDTQWRNPMINWDSSKYCDIYQITIPKDLLWTPDIVVLESIKTEFAAKESPYVNVNYWGYTHKTEILTLTTACNMDLYRFPFDTQNCTLTFEPLMYSEEDVKVWGYSYKGTTNNQVTPNNQDTPSNQSFQIPGEWQLVNLKESNSEGKQISFQMIIKRKPLVYVINLIFPVFCFLVLDLASFFINASQADKLTFKVTLLLTISVVLQVLNDRLTATTSGVPLIGVYCGVVFTLIGLSILETILVNVLTAKGKKAKSVKPEKTRTGVTGPADHVNDINSLETSGNEDATCMIEIGKKSSPWTKAAKIVDVTFIVLYIITIIVFLSIIGSQWFN